MRVARKARTRVSARVVLIVAAVTVAIAVHELWSWTGTRPMVGIAGAQSEGAFGLPDDAPVAALDHPAVLDVPAGVFDEVDATRVPGVLPIQEVPAEVEARVQALADERDRVMRPDPADLLPRQIIEPPDDPEAPPRVDSGDLDPDRVTGTSIALPPRNPTEAEQ